MVYVAPLLGRGEMEYQPEEEVLLLPDNAPESVTVAPDRLLDWNNTVPCRLNQGPGKAR